MSFKIQGIFMPKGQNTAESNPAPNAMREDSMGLRPVNTAREQLRTPPIITKKDSVANSTHEKNKSASIKAKNPAKGKKLSIVNAPKRVKAKKDDSSDIVLRKEGIVIQNRLGLHARAAARLAQAVEDLDAEVYVCKDNYKDDAKSILELLGLCCSYGTSVKVLTTGHEAQKALDIAVYVIENKFGEME
jgi:phosphocarrier protein